MSEKDFERKSQPAENSTGQAWDPNRQDWQTEMGKPPQRQRAGGRVPSRGLPHEVGVDKATRGVGRQVGLSGGRAPIRQQPYGPGRAGQNGRGYPFDPREYTPDQREFDPDRREYNPDRREYNPDQREYDPDQRFLPYDDGGSPMDDDGNHRWENDSQRGEKKTSVLAILLSATICVAALAAAAYFAIPSIKYHFFENHGQKGQKGEGKQTEATPTPFIEIMQGEGTVSGGGVDVTEEVAALPTLAPTSVPTSIPIPKSFAGAVSREQQEALLVPGQQLDLTHMNNLIANTGATYGTYCLDVTNMQDYDAGNADTSYPASALIGVPILFTYAQKVNSGEIQENAQVVFSYTFSGGRGIYKNTDHGRSFSAYDMMAQALKNSDNNALNSMMDFLTLSEINRVCHSFGYNSVDMQRKLMSQQSSLENYISAKDAAMMLNALYQDTTSPIGRSYLQVNFRISAQDSSNIGMYKGLGSYPLFLNLNGIRDDMYNEVSIVQNGSETFILSCLTTKGKAQTSAGGIASMAGYVGQTLRDLGN